MSNAQLSAILLDLFRKHLEDPTLTGACLYKEHPTWSSLRALIVVNAIEQHTQILLGTEDLNACATIEDIAKRVASLQQM